ncbi:hypothetical protein D3C78_1402410 [compost metagenome]
MLMDFLSAISLLSAASSRSSASTRRSPSASASGWSAALGSDWPVVSMRRMVSACSTVSDMASSPARRCTSAPLSGSSFSDWITPRVTTRLPVFSLARLSVVGASAPPTSLVNCSRFSFVVSSSIGEKPVPATVLPAAFSSPPPPHSLASRQVRIDLSPSTFTTAVAAVSEFG